MQVEGDHIGSGESAPGQTGEEEFAGQAGAAEAYLAPASVCRMSRHHHPATLPMRYQSRGTMMLVTLSMFR